MQINPRTNEAYKLFHKGTLAFANAEKHGIRVDTDYTQKKYRQLTRRIERIEKEIINSDFAKPWKEKYGNDLNLKSPKQLQWFLYDELGLTPKKKTPTGQGSTDDDALKFLNIPELDQLLYSRRLKKIRDYIELFQREAIEGYMHPVFNLHFARTFRSSSNSPNFQNIPKRDEEAMQITRSALFPRPGHQILEIDYGSLEVRIAACYHEDPNMLRYIKDPSTDMHGDMAKQIFLIDNFDRGVKSHALLRSAAKNGFVFPQFYGDYYGNNAKGLCEWTDLPQSRWKDGQGIELDSRNISDHLREKGIRSYTGFENHLKEIERHFWEERFPKYEWWKKTWWNLYQKYGYIDMKTGFRCSGVMSRNDCINYPVQGAAFHCLLWSFIKLDEISRKEKWDSRLIGQIHDSIIIDTHPDELDHIKEIAQDVTCKQLPEAWPWIIVPLEVNMELCEIDGSWADKIK